MNAELPPVTMARSVLILFQILTALVVAVGAVKIVQSITMNVTVAHTRVPLFMESVSTHLARSHAGAAILIIRLQQFNAQYLAHSVSLAMDLYAPTLTSVRLVCIIVPVAILFVTILPGRFCALAILAMLALEFFVASHSARLFCHLRFNGIPEHLRPQWALHTRFHMAREVPRLLRIMAFGQALT
jgi:hypothetical protein